MTCTVFCQQVNQPGAIHTDTVTASGPDSAIHTGRRQGLAGWNSGPAETKGLSPWKTSTASAWPKAMGASSTGKTNRIEPPKQPIPRHNSEPLKPNTPSVFP